VLILIVEDDPLVASFVAEGMAAALFRTEVAEDVQSALARVWSGGVDLVILDLRLRGGTGVEVLRELRGRGSSVPVIVLTGQHERWGPTECLNLGADDYMVKPFAFDELLARVRVRLRPVEVHEAHVLRSGTLELNLETCRACVSGEPVELTARELALLETFLRHPGQVLGRAQLIDLVWGMEVSEDSNVVNVYVASLRGKLGPNMIETVRGLGYRLVVTGEAD
jgi:DNA-binding response OmpR family regulator